MDAAAAVAAAQGLCEPLPPEDPDAPRRPDCLRERETSVLGGLPDGWSIDSPVNDDGTPAWEYTYDPVVRGGEMRTVAAGPRAKDDRLVSTPCAVSNDSELAIAHRWVRGEGDGIYRGVAVSRRRCQRGVRPVRSAGRSRRHTQRQSSGVISSSSTTQGFAGHRQLPRQTDHADDADVTVAVAAGAPGDRRG